MKKKYLAAMLVLVVQNSIAQDSPPVSLGFGLNASTYSDETVTQESGGYQLSLGYHLSESFVIEGGYADYQATENELNFNPVQLGLKAFLPVSDYASLYFGGGLSYDSVPSPMLKVGVNYRLSDAWHVNFGYQGNFGVENLNNEDLYSVYLGVNYRFGQAVAGANQAIEPRPSTKFEVTETPEPSKPTSSPEKVAIDEKPEREDEGFESPSICMISLGDYRVVEGDYLINIALKHGMTLEQLLNSNIKLTQPPRNIELIYPGELVKVMVTQCK
ncbi:outer membrane beta-barrel protein [Shewanella algae]|uniref:outer membrane beta-barrel protein n=1 Tax=Shewanella algae TaxID=38313 RepID=UPI001F482989|nr:outer membrane beta-barrel protein [Shewanella algae]MCE9785758.1 outer membrane beta-barrel protein [Shewanella algae]